MYREICEPKLKPNPNTIVTAEPRKYVFVRTDFSGHLTIKADIAILGIIECDPRSKRPSMIRPSPVLRRQRPHGIAGRIMISLYICCPPRNIWSEDYRIAQEVLERSGEAQQDAKSMSMEEEA